MFQIRGSIVLLPNPIATHRFPSHRRCFSHSQQPVDLRHDGCGESVSPTSRRNSHQRLGGPWSLLQLLQGGCQQLSSSPTKEQSLWVFFRRWFENIGKGGIRATSVESCVWEIGIGPQGAALQFGWLSRAWAWPPPFAWSTRYSQLGSDPS